MQDRAYNWMIKSVRNLCNQGKIDEARGLLKRKGEYLKESQFEHLNKYIRQFETCNVCLGEKIVEFTEFDDYFPMKCPTCKS